MTRLAIIHTTVATVEPLKVLAGELLPGCAVVYFVDESILPLLAASDGDLEVVREHLLAYARFAESAGADVILNACSSVGELVAEMRAAVRVPIVRIDEPLAEEAVAYGRRIGVAATVPTTLNPTLRLIQQKATAVGQHIEIDSLLVPDAFRRLSAGDRQGHDALVRDALDSLARGSDVVVLAQASMARVLPQLSVDERRKCLSSPRLGMERVKCVLDSRRA